MSAQESAHSVSQLKQFRSDQRTMMGRCARIFESVSSTNTIARRWALNDAPEGSLVLADHQHAGRGRLGRQWFSRPGKNLTFSLILHPQWDPSHLGLLPLLAGLAVADALEGTFPVRPALKWPNDVLLQGKKCGGVLSESIWSSGETHPRAVILGIGLNVNQQSFPPALQDPATSVRCVLQHEVERVQLLNMLLDEIEALYDPAQIDIDQFISSYEKRLAHLHRVIRMHSTVQDRDVEGLCSGISGTGALVLKTRDGDVHFSAGEVSSKSIG